MSNNNLRFFVDCDLFYSKTDVCFQCLFNNNQSEVFVSSDYILTMYV